MLNDADVIVYDGLFEVVTSCVNRGLHNFINTLANKYYYALGYDYDIGFEKDRLNALLSDLVVSEVIQSGTLKYINMRALYNKVLEFCEGKPSVDDYSRAILAENIVTLLDKVKNGEVESDVSVPLATALIAKAHEHQYFEKYLDILKTKTDSSQALWERNVIDARNHANTHFGSVKDGDINFINYFTVRNMFDFVHFVIRNYENLQTIRCIPLSEVVDTYSDLSALLNSYRYHAASQVLTEAELGLLDKKIKFDYGPYIDLVPFLGIRGALLCRDEDYCHNVLTSFSKKDLPFCGSLDDFIIHLCNYSNDNNKFCSAYYRTGIECIRTGALTRNLVNDINEAKDTAALESCERELKKLIAKTNVLLSDMKKIEPKDKNTINNIKTLRKYPDGFKSLADTIFAKKCLFETKPFDHLRPDAFSFDKNPEL